MGSGGVPARPGPSGVAALRQGRRPRATRPERRGTDAVPSRPALARLQRLPQRLLIGLVQAYRWLLSPWLGSQCRFEPSCSGYALAALQQHGAVGGLSLTGRRLLRCHPWCCGGLDPVPPAKPEPTPSSPLPRAESSA
jgi:uncharacterized protein